MRFAGREATSLLSRGESPRNVALSLHAALVNRSLALVNEVAGESPLVFSGGVAHHACVRELFTREYPGDVFFPEKPDLTGAIGAALLLTATQDAVEGRKAP